MPVIVNIAALFLALAAGHLMAGEGTPWTGIALAGAAGFLGRGAIELARTA